MEDKIIMKQQKQIMRRGEHDSSDYGQECAGGGQWDDSADFQSGITNSNNKWSGYKCN